MCVKSVDRQMPDANDGRGGPEQPYKHKIKSIMGADDPKAWFGLAFYGTEEQIDCIVRRDER